jgi:hypothetical protein
MGPWSINDGEKKFYNIDHRIGCQQKYFYHVVLGLAHGKALAIIINFCNHYHVKILEILGFTIRIQQLSS